MRVGRIFRLVGLLLACNLLSKPSWALFDNYGLDATYCQQPTVRSTVVYIDDMMMADQQSEWAVKLAVKLRATLTPGEHVSVVRLSPESGQSKEYWSGCWPDYPAAKRAELAQQTYILQQNPVDKIADQQKYFLRDFGAALTRIYLDSKRPPSEVQVAADNPPQKQILRALASDEGRFSDSPHDDPGDRLFRHGREQRPWVGIPAYLQGSSGLWSEAWVISASGRVLRLWHGRGRSR